MCCCESGVVGVQLLRSVRSGGRGDGTIFLYIAEHRAPAPRIPSSISHALALVCVRQGHLRAKEGKWAAGHAALAPLSRRFHAVFTPFLRRFHAVFTPFSRRSRTDLTPLSHRNDSEIGVVPRRSLCEVTPNRSGAMPHRRDRCGRCGRCPPSGFVARLSVGKSGNSDH